MKILGVHIGHDSSASLIIDGKIVADVAEERFTRLKHYSGLPRQAVDYCLKSQGITMDNIDVIAIPKKNGAPHLNFLFDFPAGKKRKKSKRGQLLEIYNNITNRQIEKPPLYIKSFKVADHTAIIHIEHHLAHAAAAYYTNPLNEKQLIVTMDGAGDNVSIGLWRGENNKITLLKKFGTDASIGWFYSNVTEALGWWHGDGEGKTMGLAPYGNYSTVKGKLDKYYPKFSAGDIIEPHEFGRSTYWNEFSSNQFHFDDAYKIKKLIEKYGKEDISAEAQRVLEEQSFNIILPWLAKENTRNLTCAGGVFLNVKLNQKLWETGEINNHHIFPNAGDSGLAVGAALAAYFKLNPHEKIHVLDHLYLGPEYTDKEIEEILKLRNLNYSRVEEIEKFAAQKLAENKIVAWFQGRMESGPRALGNRSILMSANNAKNKDIINARVKFRESFRPFCPSILWEKKEEYLEKPRDEFYMITSFTCPENKRAKVPAVVHADYTLRPQTVKKESNKKYWSLIKEFGDLTGEYLLLNTSMNIMGEPVINNPREAIRCFYDNGLDYLIMGNFVLSKE